MAHYQAAEIKCLVWTNKWLVLGNSKEMLYWKPITGKEIQDEAPCQIPVRARLLCGAPDNKIVAARTTGILFFLLFHSCLIRIWSKFDA